MDLAWLSNQTNWTNYEIMKERPHFEAIPRKYHIYIILLYSGTATLAFISNLITLLVLKNNTNISKNLTKYLINLSYSDLMMSAFSIPFTYTTFMFGQWYFEPHLCSFVLAIQFYCVFVSVFILVAIGLDRYTAIINPLRSKTGKNSANLILFLIWFVGFLISSVWFSISEATEVNIGNSTIYICRETLSEDELKYFVVMIFMITFMIPVLILVYVYTSMATVIFQRDLNNSARLMLKEQKRKVFKILVNVVLAFVLCWAPLQLMNLVTVLFPQTRIFNTESELNRYVLIYFAFHWLAMVHSTINPIIYSFMSQSFREEFIKLFLTNDRKKKQSSNYYSVSCRHTTSSIVD